MDADMQNKLIRRYESVSFSVVKKVEYLMKDEISEDLTNDQHAMLRFIQNYGPCTSTALADAFFVKKSAITAIINRLNEKGLITRQRDDNDRRVVYLTLSERGKKIYNESERKIHQLVEDMITKFSDDEITSFINTYEKLSKTLDHMIEQSKEETS